MIIPKDLLQTAKIEAIKRQTSLSRLIEQGLKREIYGENIKRKKSKIRDDSLLRLLGKRSIGINKFRREDIYDDHLRKKMSY